MSYKGRKLCISTVAYLTTFSMQCTDLSTVHSILVSTGQHGEGWSGNWDFK